MAKFAVTLSNDKIVYPIAQCPITARRKVEKKIAETGKNLTITDVRLITGRIR